MQPVPAAEGEVADALADEDGAELPAEFEFSLELISAYVFRGYNVFQESSQREQHLVQRPRFIWTPPGTGLSLGYSAANQLTGTNLSHNVAVGLGAEQDLFALYELRRHSPLGVLTELSLVSYPFAAKDVAGTAVPLFVSAAAELRYQRSAFVYLGYLRGIRPGPFGDNYFYLNPRLDKRWDVGRRFALEVEVGAGVKFFPDGAPVVRDNALDVLASATLYFAVSDLLYLGVKAGWAWTNFKQFRDLDSGQIVTPGFGDEYVPFWSLTVGTELSRAVTPVRRGPSRRRITGL